MKAFTPIFLFLFLITACSSTKDIQEPEPEKQPETTEEPQTPDYRISQHPTTQATAWVQNSAEYKATAIQTYRTAHRTLPIPLQDSFWTASLDQSGKNFNTLPPAIILDVDETVLDNSPFQARMIKQQSSFNMEAWNEWCNEAKADAIPGAVEFTTFAADQGVAVFFITNREHEVEDATRKNLKDLGFPVPDSLDNILSNNEQPNWNSSKVERRKLIEKDYRVIMIFGDDLNDFTSAKNISQSERDSIIDNNTNYFGRRWYMLPNPVYGSWDQAMYNFKSGLSEAERENTLLQNLDTKRDN